jgi:glutamine amidotransferase-like uncharacterized protein
MEVLSKHALCAIALSLLVVACGRTTLRKANGGAALDSQPPSPTQRCGFPLRVALYTGPGAWPEGVTALREIFLDSAVQLVETSTGHFRADETDLLIVGGGWAPSQRATFGEAGLAEVRRFVAVGGGYLGICAGAYLASHQVRWEGATYSYPLGLFEGTAEGPIVGLPSWPGFGPVDLAIVAPPSPSIPAEGEASSALAVEASSNALPPRLTQRSLVAHYFGGASFSPITSKQTVLLRYPNGAAATVAFAFEQGRVVLTGPHLEGPRSAEATSVEVSRAYLRQLALWAGTARCTAR